MNTITSKKINLKQEMRVVASILILRFENNMYIVFIHKQLWFIKKEIKKFFCFMSIIFFQMASKYLGFKYLLNYLDLT